MRYYCHSCQAEVDGRDTFDDVERDPECVTCGSSFVEKVGQDVESFLRIPEPPSSQPPSQSLSESSSQSSQPAPPIPPQPETNSGTSTVSSFQTSPHVVTMLQVGRGRGSVPMNVIGGGGGGRGGPSALLSMLLQGTGLLGGATQNTTGSGLDEILHQLFMNDPGAIPTPTTPEVMESLRRERNDEALAQLGECGITLEPFEPGDVALIMPCDHAFKEEAIVQWLQTHNTCPVCREAIPEDTTS